MPRLVRTDGPAVSGRRYADVTAWIASLWEPGQLLQDPLDSDLGYAKAPPHTSRRGFVVSGYGRGTGTHTLPFPYTSHPCG